MNEIQKLPDGSGCFTATILSEEEIAALPPNRRPLKRRISCEIYHTVFEAIHAASLCWNPKPTGVFNSEQASEIAVELCLKIADEIESKAK